MRWRCKPYIGLTLFSMLLYFFSALGEEDAGEPQCRGFSYLEETTKTMACTSEPKVLLPEKVCNGQRDCMGGEDEWCVSLQKFEDGAGTESDLRCPFMRWPLFNCQAAICFDVEMIESVTGKIVSHLLCRQMAFATYRTFGWIDRSVSNFSGVSEGGVRCHGWAMSASQCLYRPVDFSFSCPRFLGLSCLSECFQTLRIPNNSVHVREITSTGFPDLTLSDLNCKWRLEAQDPNVVIALQFVVLNLHEPAIAMLSGTGRTMEGYEESCMNSHIMLALGKEVVTDGNTTTIGYRKEEVCHLEVVKDRVIMSTGPVLYMSYQSGRYMGELMGRQGFLLRYWTVSCNENGTYCFDRGDNSTIEFKTTTSVGMTVGSAVGGVIFFTLIALCYYIKQNRIAQFRRRHMSTWPKPSRLWRVMRGTETWDGQFRLRKVQGMIVETEGGEERRAPHRPHGRLPAQSEPPPISPPYQLPSPPDSEDEEVFLYNEIITKADVEGLAERARVPAEASGAWKSGAGHRGRRRNAVQATELDAPWTAECPRCMRKRNYKAAPEGMTCQHQRNMEAWVSSKPVIASRLEEKHSRADIGIQVEPMSKFVMIQQPTVRMKDFNDARDSDSLSPIPSTATLSQLPRAYLASTGEVRLTDGFCPIPRPSPIHRIPPPSNAIGGERSGDARLTDSSDNGTYISLYPDSSSNPGSEHNHKEQEPRTPATDQRPHRSRITRTLMLSDASKKKRSILSRGHAGTEIINIDEYDIFTEEGLLLQDFLDPNHPVHMRRREEENGQAPSTSEGREVTVYRPEDLSNDGGPEEERAGEHWLRGRVSRLYSNIRQLPARLGRAHSPSPHFSPPRNHSTPKHPRPVWTGERMQRPPGPSLPQIIIEHVLTPFRGGRGGPPRTQSTARARFMRHKSPFYRNS